MASSPKQRYRPNCPYFNFACKPAGKYSLECEKPWYRPCIDKKCKATPVIEPVVTRKTGQMQGAGA